MKFGIATFQSRFWEYFVEKKSTVINCNFVKSTKFLNNVKGKVYFKRKVQINYYIGTLNLLTNTKVRVLVKGGGQDCKIVFDGE